jgi:DNA invertase Pin-like site-specific DNA recombinase
MSNAKHSEGHDDGRYVALYVRVSSKRQDHASQRPDLERYARSLPGGVATKWYADSFTGRTMDRPGWAKLMRDVDARRVSRVVV